MRQQRKLKSKTGKKNARKKILKERNFQGNVQTAEMNLFVLSTGIACTLAFTNR